MIHPLSYSFFGILLCICTILFYKSFGIISTICILLCIHFRILRVKPLLNLCKSVFYTVFPNTAAKIKDNLNKSFKILPNEEVTKGSDGRYIFMWHPHGLFAASMHFHNETDFTDWPKDIKLKATVFSGMRWLPFIHDFMEGFGGIFTSYDIMKETLENTCSISVVPGGMREMLYPGATLIKKRRGIFKMALETGSSLVPIYSKNEDAFCEIVDLPSWIQDIFKAYDVSIPIPTWKSIQKIFSLLHKPFEEPIVSSMGKPIPVEKIENPSEKDISDLRLRYMKELNILTENTLEIL
jgi:hypothetical protein